MKKSLFGLVLGGALTLNLTAQVPEAAAGGEPVDADCLYDWEAGFENPLILNSFSTDSVALSNAEESAIAKYADALGRVGKVCVIGWADKRGPSAHNDRLAMNRARAVAARLIQAGVDPRVLSLSSRAEAFGDGLPDWFWFSGSRRVEVVPVR